MNRLQKSHVWKPGRRLCECWISIITINNASLKENPTFLWVPSTKKRKQRWNFVIFSFLHGWWMWKQQRQCLPVCFSGAAVTDLPSWLLSTSVSVCLLVAVTERLVPMEHWPGNDRNISSSLSSTCLHAQSLPLFSISNILIPRLNGKTH